MINDARFFAFESPQSAFALNEPRYNIERRKKKSSERTTEKLINFISREKKVFDKVDRPRRSEDRTNCEALIVALSFTQFFK